MLKIGWSERDVSTTEPVILYGQMHCRISKGILDPIMLSCLVLEDGNDCVIFLSGDFEHSGEVLDTIREKTAKKRGDISVEKIIFHVTHTHTAPLIRKTHSFCKAPLDNVTISSHESYREFMTDMAAEAIVEAWDNRKEGSFSYGYGYAVVGHQRRAVYLDETSHTDSYAVMYGNTSDDLFGGFENGADHFINLLYTFDQYGKLTGALINIPCPSQNSEIEWMISSSYWNEVRTLIREKYGNIYLLPQCAAAGDTCPNLQHYLPAQERRFDLKFEGISPYTDLLSPRQKYVRMDIALRIRDAFDEVLSWCKKEKFTEVPICHTVKTINLEKRIVTDDEYASACKELAELEQAGFVDTGDLAADLKTNTKRSTRMVFLEEIIQRYDDQKFSDTLPMELHVVRVGDIAFATNTFELYQEFQHRIQARSPFIQTFVVQLCGQPDDYNFGGYLATHRAVRHGGYSAILTSNRVSADGGKTLVDETVSELKKLY